jgi:hypothetical protein
MNTVTSSVVDSCYNLPDLMHAKDDVVAVKIFQIVEEVKAHLPVAKQETVSENSCFCCLTSHFRILFYIALYYIYLFISLYITITDVVECS